MMNSSEPTVDFHFALHDVGNLAVRMEARDIGIPKELSMEAIEASVVGEIKSPAPAHQRLLRDAAVDDGACLKPATGGSWMRILRLIAAASLIATSALIVGEARVQGGSEAMSKPGAHLVLLLDAAEVRASWLSSMRDEIRSRLREAKVGFGGLAVADNVVRVRLAKPEDADAALKALADLAPASPGGILERVLGLMWGSATSDIAVAKGEGGNITITPTEAGLGRRMNAALDNAVVIAGRRLEGMGVAATAVRQGRDRIYVHAPALQDTSALKELLTKPARLGFHEVVSAEEARQGRVPVGFKSYSAPPGALLLREIPVVRGNDLIDAQATFDRRTDEPIIAFRFNNAGARTFARYTAENVGRPFAIVLDDVVVSTPVIREPILGGSGQVSGNFTVEAARQLAVQLRAGALPAKLAVVEERVVPVGR
jgi:protein-export membrane protein SecD